MLDKMISVFHEYSGTGFIIGLYFMAMLYLFVIEKRKNIRIYFLYVPLGILFVFFNPIVAKIVYSVVGDEIYYRILWLLPIIITIAYAFVSIVMRLKEKSKIIVVSFLVLCVVLGGKCVYLNPYFSSAENLHHMPNEVIRICDVIRVDGREVMAAFPIELVQYVRQYDPTICMPYGREMTVEDWIAWHAYDLYLEMNKEVLDASEIARYAKELSCHYVILPEKKEMSGDLEKYGFDLVDVIEGYRIYKDPSLYFGL